MRRSRVRFSLWAPCDVGRTLGQLPCGFRPGLDPDVGDNPPRGARAPSRRGVPTSKTRARPIAAPCAFAQSGRHGHHHVRSDRRRDLRRPVARSPAGPASGRPSRRPHRGRRQGLRTRGHRGAGPRRRRRRRHRGPVHGHHGPVRLRQEHVDALPRRPRHAHLGPGLHRRRRARFAVGRRADPPAARAGRIRLPVVQPPPDAHRSGEHHAADGPRRHASPTRSGCARSSTRSASRTG